MIWVGVELHTLSREKAHPDCVMCVMLLVHHRDKDMFNFKAFGKMFVMSLMWIGSIVGGTIVAGVIIGMSVRVLVDLAAYSPLVKFGIFMSGMVVAIAFFVAVVEGFNQRRKA